MHAVYTVYNPMNVEDDDDNDESSILCYFFGYILLFPLLS